MPLPRPLPELRELAGSAAHTPTLDPHTWADLDLDEVFEAIATGLSTLGRLALYRWLSAPITTDIDRPRPTERLATGRALRAQAARWAPVAQALDDLPWLPALLMAVLAGTARLPTFGRLPTLLAAGAVLAGLGFLVSTKVGVACLALAYLVTLAFNLWGKRRLDQALGSLEFVSVALRCAQLAARAGLEGLGDRASRLQVLVEHLRPLAAAASEASLPAVFDDFPGEYARILTLSRERRLSRCAQLIERHRVELTELFQLLGELEAGQAAARFAETRQVCAPQFDGDALEVRDARHPLLPNGVGNDLTLAGGLVVTGSNMSGKSTFLRTLAFNAVLAQSLGFACAQRYRAPVLRIGTSLRSQDQLASGQSAWSAEATRLRELLELAQTHRPVLLLVDEPFRGTNTIERVASAVAVLAELRGRGALLVAATHDFEVVDLLGPTWQAGYFVEQVVDGAVKFDHRFHLGRAMPRNAVRLLEVLGFPPEVVAHARQLAARGATAPAPLTSGGQLAQQTGPMPE